MASSIGLFESSISLLNHASSSMSLIPADSVAIQTATFTSSDLSYTASKTVSSSPQLSIMITATPMAIAQQGDGSGSDSKNNECELLGPFALFIQGALGGLALLSLVFKRWRERPQRPLKVWAFDASKQVVGSILLHIANLLMSMLSSGQLTVTPAVAGGYQANPCSFYLLNLAIDTTIGIPILIVLLRLLTVGFSLTPLGEPPESIQSGNYGRPPKTMWWLKQSSIYFVGLLGMKSCVFVIFQLCPWIVRVGDWALRWTEGNEKVQVFFVMLFFPVVMNALQYYIIDSFIKDQKPSDHDPIPSEDNDDDDGNEAPPTRRRRSRGYDRGIGEVSDSDSEDENTITDEAVKTLRAEDDVNKATNVKIEPKKLGEYDPDTDGAKSAASSSSGPDYPSILPKTGNTKGNNKPVDGSG